MKYAKECADVQALIAVRDCGVLRAVNGPAAARFYDVHAMGLINVKRGPADTVDISLSESGRQYLREQGLDA